MKKVDAVVKVRHRDVASSVVQVASYYMLNAIRVGAEPFIVSIMVTIDGERLRARLMSLTGSDEEVTEIRFRVADPRSEAHGSSVVVRMKSKSRKFVAEQFLIRPKSQ